MSPPHFVAAAIIRRGCGVVPFVIGDSDPSMRTTYRRRHITRSVIPRIFYAGEFSADPLGYRWGSSPKRFLEFSRLENADSDRQFV